MNKIKFRAWNKKEKVFFHYKDGIHVGVMLDGSKAMVIDDEEDVEYSLFTGIKDVNGKEIYEGDIVKLLGLNNNERVAEIVFSKENASFNVKEKVEGEGEIIHYWDFSFLSRCKTKIEVIGNVFENKELLENKLEGEQSE